MKGIVLVKCLKKNKIKEVKLSLLDMPVKESILLDKCLDKFKTTEPCILEISSCKQELLIDFQSKILEVPEEEKDLVLKELKELIDLEELMVNLKAVEVIDIDIY